MDKTPKRALNVIDTEAKCKKAIEVYYWWSSKDWRNFNKRKKFFSVQLQVLCPYHKQKKNEKHRYEDEEIEEIENYKFRQYRCKENRKSFNATTNTIFFKSRIPLRKWFEAFWYYRREVWRKDINKVSEVLQIDRRTVKRMFSKFDFLPLNEKKLPYEIKNKYSVFQDVKMKKKFEKEEITKEELRAYYSQKYKTRDKIIINKRFVEKHKDKKNKEELEHAKLEEIINRKLKSKQIKPI